IPAPFQVTIVGRSSIEGANMRVNRSARHGLASPSIRRSTKGCAAAMIGCLAVVGMQAVRAADPATACASLAGMAIRAADIGLPTTGGNVTAASLVLADAPQNANGEYCLVRASILPVDPA